MLGRKGFSLVELLVVIAVITALMALLFPIITSARNMAYKATCQSNLRQINLALRMYAHDYRDYYPQHTERPRFFDGKVNMWKMRLKPYFDQLGKGKWTLPNEILHCPADFDTDPSPGHDVSYAYTTQIDGGPAPFFIPYDRRQQFAVLADGYGYLRPRYDFLLYRHDTNRRDNGEKPDRIRQGKKGGTANVLFADGHVENLHDLPDDRRRLNP